MLYENLASSVADNGVGNAQVEIYNVENESAQLATEAVAGFINSLSANSEGVVGYDGELMILRDPVIPIVSITLDSSTNELVITAEDGFVTKLALPTGGSEESGLTPEQEELINQIPQLKEALTKVQSDLDSLSTEVESISANMATTEFVNQKISDLIGGAPEALDTLKEIAEAIENGGDTIQALTEVVGKKADQTALDEEITRAKDAEATKATKDELNSLKSEVDLKADKTEIPSLDGYATEEWVEGKNYLTEHQDISDLATKEELNEEVAARGEADTQLQSDIQSEATTARAAEKELSDKVASLESEVSIKANQADVDSQVNIINSTTQKLQEDLSYVADTVIPQMNENTAKALEQKVTWELGTKIQLPLSDGAVSGIINAGTPESPEVGDGAQLLGLSKWNKVEVGSSKVQLNLNGPKGEDDRPTYNDDFKIALQKDIPDVSDLATKSELTEVEGKIPSLNGYATQEWVGEQGFLTEHQDISGLATKEELNAKADTSVVTKLQSDLTNVADVIIPEMNTNTAKGLDSKVSWDEEKKVISIPVDGSISALRESNPEEGTQPEGGVLLAQRTYDSGVTLVTEVGTTKNKLTLNASERPQVDIAGGSSEKMAYLSEIPTALPSPAALTIKYNGVQAFTYNGSTAETGNFIVNASTIPMSDSDTTTLLAKIEALEARIAELESK
jgi:hypothetical protein